MDDLTTFVEHRIREEAERAQAYRAMSRQGDWVGVDPARLAADIDQTNTHLRAAIAACREGRDDGERLRLHAFALFRPHPDYREEWRPKLP